MTTLEITPTDSAGLPDLRLPIGIFFIIVALILEVASLDGELMDSVAAVSEHADRYWGFVLLVFGLGMSFFGWRAGSAANEGPSDSAAGAPTTPPHSAAQE